MAFVTLPTATELIVSTSLYMTDIFVAILPWALAGLGLILVGPFIRFLVGKLKGGVKGALGSRRGGRRRRR